MRFAAALLLLGLMSAPLKAQSPVDRARTLRDGGDLAGAAEVLRQHLANRPDDLVALTLLAETSYWQRDFDGAVALWRRALDLAPADDGIRLAFGQVLVELQRADEARAILEPLTDRTDGFGAEAGYQLALLDWWSGELTRARDGFRNVLEREPAHPGATEALHAIRADAAPWLRMDPRGARDTQTLSRAGADIEAGGFLSPLVTATVAASLTRFAWSDSSASVASGEARLQTRFVAARTSLALGGGVAHWTSTGDTRFIGAAAITTDLARHLAVDVAASRSPYTWTTASLGTPLTPQRYTARLILDVPASWAGELGARTDGFADGNRVDAFWAWLIAPILHGGAGDLRLGWQAGFQDARASRSTPVPNGMDASGTPLYSGRFVPYYTPERIFAHGPAGAFTLRLSGRVTFSANGSWGAFAKEDAPFWYAPDTVPGTPPVMGVYRRSFQPLELHGSLRIATSRRADVYIEATHARTAFYDDTRGRAGVIVRFLPSGS